MTPSWWAVRPTSARAVLKCSDARAATHDSRNPVEPVSEGGSGDADGSRPRQIGQFLTLHNVIQRNDLLRPPSNQPCLWEPANDSAGISCAPFDGLHADQAGWNP